MAYEHAYGLASEVPSKTKARSVSSPARLGVGNESVNQTRNTITSKRRYRSGQAHSGVRNSTHSGARNSTHSGARNSTHSGVRNSTGKVSSGQAHSENASEINQTEFQAAVNGTINELSTESFAAEIKISYDALIIRKREKEGEELLPHNVVMNSFGQADKKIALDNIEHVVKIWMKQENCPLRSAACTELTSALLSSMTSVEHELTPDETTLFRNSIKEFVCLWIFKSLERIYDKMYPKKTKPRDGGEHSGGSSWVDIGDDCLMIVVFIASVRVILGSGSILRSVVEYGLKSLGDYLFWRKQMRFLLKFNVQCVVARPKSPRGIEPLYEYVWPPSPYTPPSSYTHPIQTYDVIVEHVIIFNNAKEAQQAVDAGKATNLSTPYDIQKAKNAMQYGGINKVVIPLFFVVERCHQEKAASAAAKQAWSAVQKVGRNGKVSLE